MVGKLRELSPNDSLHAFYGWEVRRCRGEAGISLTDLARELNYSKATISRIETAERVPSRQMSEQIDQLLNTGGHFTRLWPHVDREVFPHRAKRYIELEQRASRIRAFHAHVMPGLLQTEAYVRALLRLGDFRDEAAYEEGVASRLGRQGLLRGPRPPRFWLILDEGALRRQVGGPEIMREQLTSILVAARERHIDVQVLPFTEAIHPGCSLSLLVLRDRSRWAYREAQGWYHLTGIPDDVVESELDYDRFIASALPLEDSLAFVKSVLEECYPCPQPLT